MSDERLIILQKIQSGEISVEDGSRIIDALDGRIDEDENQQPESGLLESGVETALPEQVDVIATGQEKTAPPDFSGWRVWSWVAFGLFVLLTAMGAVWMVQGWQTRPWGWGFWLAWIPFVIGLLGMISTYNVRWLHVRIRRASGDKPERIAVSLPLPLGLATVIVGFFSRWMPPHVREKNIAEILRDLDKNITKDEPLHIQVDDEDGEHVEVFIG